MYLKYFINEKDNNYDKHNHIELNDWEQVLQQKWLIMF